MALIVGSLTEPGPSMKTYQVEEMAGETPVSRQTVTANSPWEAASIGTKKEVQARRDERLWVRVTEESSRSVYKYAFK
ncbi:MAG: hypothetical protein E5X72_30630 [Mesorhizobium sp.]|uniref:hypothetical protein n=1 Tax=Mesorhizobium sp. TaxID=1871066 RepID=UPI0012244D74|nr:hypothetical protein [Mesorhizobium sp.]TIP00309.1 MAG: hypothetical protein E5X72_30630 [Mesorhizobium sp.]